ncbi:zinc-ribbon domain-containing protein [Anaeromyxobacter oryzae]|uniref:Zinc finger/thioredoxin putative domain-containing protein n=1 Tax=Anaeromyxobacter oryzae TaxID=2918170 RepID=A0ABN6MY64_9BACT|nr:zinc-ribbon domain-containing protein [Anaeromyxobacter oryzae]BDG04668.1 hypothetical protein AMOR_36640 [Anaeromyxobacter oryzae]
MIVICTRCQAKFKVADEKVGPRGAKVRCSRCQDVFLVHRDLGTMPVAGGAPAVAPPRPARVMPNVELEVAPAGRPAPDDPFAAALARPGPSSPAPGGPAADPFGAPGAGTPFAAPQSVAAAGADPFPGPAGDPFAPAAPDPFAPAASRGARARADDPFAAIADPFAAVVTPRAQPSRGSDLPVTDLSALLGHAPAGASAPPRSPAPPPMPGAGAGLEIADRTPAPAASTVAPAELDFSGDFDLAAEPAGAPSPDLGGGPGADLALEDRTTPGPARGIRAAGSELPAPDDPLPAPDPAPAAAAEIGFADPSEVTFYSGGDDGALALATEPTPAPSPDAPAAPPVPPAAAGAATSARSSSPRAVATAEAEDAAAAGLARIPGGRGARLRAVAVNAVALAALLVVALAFRVVWRGEAGAGASALRPSAVLGALAREGARTAALATEGVTSGLYDRANAPPVLFVRGEVVSHAAAPVGGVTVDVEIVRDGRVIARGAAPAGAIPTAEELYGSADAPALEVLSATVRGRAPAAIRPGERVAFLVAIGDVPAELAGASVRVAARPGAGAAR